jgi:hypothetical protein
MLDSVRTVDAQVRYINEEWKAKEDSPRIGSRESRRAATSFRDVVVHDAREDLRLGKLDLDECGYTLTSNVSAVGDFRDAEEVKRTYYDEMMRLVCNVSGADQAFVRSHLIRTEKPVDFNDGYARFVHCDYNVRRIREMSEELLHEHGVEPQKSWQYAWYNTWQPFDHQVQQNPLAVIDCRSLPFDDVIDYYYTGRGNDSLVAAPVYNPAHRWCYFPLMETSEVLVIKQMDEREGRAVYCPHSSFDDQTAPSDALPRRSIETRLMAVFAN